MREVQIKIGETDLIIKGLYTKEEEETGIPAMFQIEHIEPLTKDIYDLLEYCVNLPKRMDYLEVIEELVLEDILRNG